jgi:RNA polymerase sigma-70 factor (sigma-E family)
MRFADFAEARLPALLRYGVLLTGDPELARDLVQEVLARALVRWKRIDRLDEPYGYVRTMVTNEYLSVLRRRRRRPRTVPLTYDALDGPRAPVQPDVAGSIGTAADLRQRLAALPRQQRAVIVLRYYEDLSDPEIADVLGCRPATVRAYATRALAALRVQLIEPVVSEGRLR